MVFQAARRIAELDAAREGSWCSAGSISTRRTTTRYIGRIGLRDDNRDSCSSTGGPRRPRCSTRRPRPTRTAWSAACCAPRGRRWSASRTSWTTSVETDLPIVGEGALMAQLSRATAPYAPSSRRSRPSRTARSARWAGVSSLSGGPGTGKTVVALHRAAYLLYTDRRRYEGSVLVVGPSGVFMRYIERVLPSLGETAVAAALAGRGRRRRARATRHDEPAVAAVKGGAAMAELMRRTARQQAPGGPGSSGCSGATTSSCWVGAS
ncbi:MAG: hypothetical protein R2734_11755 [Nocardioides sp.]